MTLAGKLTNFLVTIKYKALKTRAILLKTKYRLFNSGKM